MTDRVTDPRKLLAAALQVARTQRDKLLVAALMFGDDAGVVVKARSLTVPAWRKRFVFDGASGDVRLVQDILRDPQTGCVAYATVSRAEKRLRRVY